MMAHSRPIALSLLVAFAPPITVGAASAQGIGSAASSGIPATAFLQFTTPSNLLPGAPPYVPMLTMPAMESAPNVVPVPGQALKRAKSGVRGHEYNGPVVILDDQALAKVR